MSRQHLIGVCRLLAVVMLLSAPAIALELDDVVARHVAARGGDAWKKIETIKVTGTYTMYSEDAPFTMFRKRPSNYRFEVEVGGRARAAATDGTTGWGSGRSGNAEREGVELAILIRESDFVNPLFDLEQRGYAAKLLGEVKFDGTPAIGIELTRADERKETWYLDPRTYLEMGKTSPGNDYLGEVERTTFYDDFRDVNGVKIPHYVESQWFTRQRIVAVESVEFNVPVADDAFEMPPPPPEKEGE
ncbi:MAG: hypothetical protein GY716_07945 [bacterium]|nr:hypothetical protein [bacterium]